MVFNFVVYRMLGNIGIAAYGIIANLAIVFTAIFTGLSCGVQPLMCRIHGKQDEPSLKYLLRLSISSALVMNQNHPLNGWFEEALEGLDTDTAP